MCLAIPGQIVELVPAETEDHDGLLRMGKVAFGGVVRRVCLAHVPEAMPGDYVLVHVGFALQRIDADEAARIFALLDELAMLEELGTESGPGGPPVIGVAGADDVPGEPGPAGEPGQAGEPPA